MALAADAHVLWRMVRGMPARGDHGQRLEAFYAEQASEYDRFREGLLHGRDLLIDRLPLGEGSSIVELGCGTGRNIERIFAKHPGVRRAWGVDLCRSLLHQARRRFQGRTDELLKLRLVEANACTWQPPAQVDVVLCAYSMTMIGDWRSLLGNARRMLKPGGLLAVADFTLIDDRVAALGGVPAQSAVTRWAWQRWFRHDGVHLEPAMVPELWSHMRGGWLCVKRNRVPYLPVQAAWFAAMGALR